MLKLSLHHQVHRGHLGHQGDVGCQVIHADDDLEEVGSIGEEEESRDSKCQQESNRPVNQAKS